jgi:hypothetical protein
MMVSRNGYKRMTSRVIQTDHSCLQSENKELPRLSIHDLLPGFPISTPTSFLW